MLNDIYAHLNVSVATLVTTKQHQLVLYVQKFIEKHYRVTMALGYEPADLTVHPSPELPRVGSFFSYRCLVFPKKMSSKEIKPEYFIVI